MDRFRRKPASEVTILKVEPGGKVLIARLTSGLASSFCNATQSFALMLGIKVLGSKDGTETIASTSPLLGSTTTAAPRATEAESLPRRSSGSGHQSSSKHSRPASADLLAAPHQSSPWRYAADNGSPVCPSDTWSNLFSRHWISHPHRSW